MHTTKKPTIDDLFEEGTQVDAAIREAARQAVVFHKLVGNPIAAWRDGKVVFVPPEGIVAPPAPAPKSTEQDAA
ncbi:MAG TPA: hypothetical protein VF796_00580 [Humisphaera sp.]